MARSRRPVARSRSQLSRSCWACPGAILTGSDRPRHPGTGGIAAAKPTVVRPSSCANRRNDRSAAVRLRADDPPRPGHCPKRRGRLTNMTMIADRPVEVDDRVQVGHWDAYRRTVSDAHDAVTLPLDPSARINSARNGGQISAGDRLGDQSPMVQDCKITEEGVGLMSTEDQVIAAIRHVQQYHDDWRGYLNDDDYQQLKDIYFVSKADDTPNRANAYGPDTLIATLRNQWPALFEGADPVSPPPKEVLAALPVGSGGHLSPPQQGTPDNDLSTRQAADAATRLNTAQEMKRSVIEAADYELAVAVLRANTTSQEGEARLRALQQSVVDFVRRLGPNLATPVAHHQLAEFLQDKIVDITDIGKSGELDCESRAAVAVGMAAHYAARALKTQCEFETSAMLRRLGVDPV